MKSLLHLLRIMFGNNYGVYPRKNDITRLSHENIKPGFRLIMRGLLLLSNLWIIPGIVIFFLFLPSLRFFVSEPSSNFVSEIKETETHTLLKDVSYEVKGLDGNPEKQTIRKGTAVQVKYRYKNRIYIEDAAGNRCYTDSPEEALGIDDYEYIPERATDSGTASIYTDQDIQELLLGKSLEEVEARYRPAMPVLRKSNGARIARLSGISEKKEDGRKGDLTLLVDSEGIIQDFAFTGKKVRAGLLDYIPVVSNVLDSKSVRRFIRGMNSPTAKIGKGVNLMGIGGKNSNKWYFVIINIILVLMFLVTILTPAAMVPYFVVLLLLISRKNTTNAKIGRIGKAASLLLFLPVAFLVCLLSDAGTALLFIVPAVVLAYFFFIPEIQRELEVLRCEICAAWNSYALINVIESGEFQTVTRTTKRTNPNSNTVNVDVSEWDEQWITYEYQCEECEEIIQISRWEVM